MLEPQTLDEASDAVRGCAADRRTMGPSGGDRARGPSAVAVDDVISMRSMNRIVEYAPSDQIVTVEAGMTIASLQDELRAHAQRLAIDPPSSATTVGGLVASNAYGPLRTRYGTVKDLIVGATIVRADGTAARGGGKVVKNVAGFDIPKLMVGTYGTLALIGTVTFRLHPLPLAHSSAIVDGMAPADVRTLTNAIVGEQLEPAAASASFDGSGYRYRVTFEGFPDGVRAQRDRFSMLAPACCEGDESPPEFESACEGELVVKLTASRSRLESLHDAAIEPLYRALVRAQACVLPFVGSAFVCGTVSDAEGVLSTLAAARVWCEREGGSLVVLSSPPAVRASFDSWGTPPPAFALMRALKERFDPYRLLQPGGFVGGL